MKKSPLAFAVLATLATTGAFAQSSVTLYGRAEAGVDLGFRVTVNNSNTTFIAGPGGSTTNTNLGGSVDKPGFRISDGENQGQASSLFGLRGTEDLGGGLKASFLLESGLNLDKGSVGNGGGNFFSRAAWVGLSGGFGEVRLGRQSLGSHGVFANGLAPGAVVRARAVPATGGGWALLSLTDDSLVIPDGLQAEIEGTVTQATSGRLFRVDGVAVDASSVFNDSTLAPLPGVRAEVHGRMQAGVLRAQSVAFEAGDTLLEIEGRVSSVDTVARRFVLRGYTVAWGTATRFEGGPASMLRTNRRVAVRGRWNTDRTGVDALSVHIEA